jgi:hypothetical protein
MNHPAEIAVYDLLQKATAGEASMSEEVIKQIASDVEAAMHKQFNSGPRDEFKLRMSNLGKPTCQLWFEKNDPEGKTDFPPHFMMNMLIGDIVEAVFKGLLRAAHVDFDDNDKVTLNLADGTEINGEYDMVMDGKVDDVKSASPWSYKNKFASVEELQKNDSFGYVAQLVGYAEAADKEVGGWWVVNKGTGEFKYVDASAVDRSAVLEDIQATVTYIESDKPFKRCFEAIPETHYRKPTGNFKLDPKTCGFCAFKHKCWPALRTLPAVKSTAKEPPMVDYVLLNEEY